jgi:glycogen debranching enzyme
MSFLEPFANHLLDTGLGTISEIFDADAPFESRGCFAQAWSVAEVLRAWAAIRGREHGVSDSTKTASVVYQNGWPSRLKRG